MSIISIKNGDAFTSSQDEVGVIAGDYATQSYVNTAISDLIDSSPSTLDTLNELAAALGDDPDFATTVILKAGGTMTGTLNTVTLNATATASGINWGTGVIGASVLNVKTDNSGWDKGQLTIEDSNAKVMKMVGEHNTSQNLYKYVILMDPDGNDNLSGGSTGDYGFFYNKDYSGTTMQMNNNVFGARDGFVMNVYDDYNGGSPNPGPFAAYGGYGYKPFIIQAEKFRLNLKDSDTSVATALVIDNTSADFRVPVQLPVYADDTARDAAVTSPEAGMTVLSGTTFQGYNGSSWVSLS